jgi:hypothetical protein
MRTSKLERRARWALALTTSLLTTAALAQDNLFTDLLVIDEVDTGELMTQIQRSNDRKTLKRSIQGIRGTATSKVSAAGWSDMAVTAYAAEPDGQTMHTDSTAKVWGADVITIYAPNAQPWEDTVVLVNASIRGEAEIPDAFPRYRVSVFGCMAMNNCSSVPDWVKAAAELPPAPLNVRPLAFTNTYLDGPSYEQRWTDMRLSFSGTQAVVPIIYYASIGVDGNKIDEQARLTGHFRWSMKLPRGVTCTSRSGLAFKGLCPTAVSD